MTPDTAVCVKPGTKLIFSGISEEKQSEWCVGEVATATFDWKKPEGYIEGSYRDGVRFGARPRHVCALSAHAAWSRRDRGDDSRQTHL